MDFLEEGVLSSFILIGSAHIRGRQPRADSLSQASRILAGEEGLA